MGNWSEKGVIITFIGVAGGQSGAALLFHMIQGDFNWPLNGQQMPGVWLGMFFAVCLLAGMLGLSKLVRHLQKPKEQGEVTI
ncbi:MAG: hypothetical protein CFE27_04195 [Alphaproteobacteria bacterium PA1]|nr:MAG: hypothetical protein CFE27_04195 [Alphaproteobacteria bacterium PA1]